MVSARMCRVHICIYGHVLLFPGRGYAHGHHNTCYLWGFGGMRMMMMIGIWTPIRDTGKQWHLAVYFLYLLVIPVFLQSNELLYRLYGLYWIYRKKIDRLYSIYYYYYYIYSTSRCISKPCHSAVRHLKCRRLGCVRWIETTSHAARHHGSEGAEHPLRSVETPHGHSIKGLVPQLNEPRLITAM